MRSRLLKKWGLVALAFAYLSVGAAFAASSDSSPSADQILQAGLSGGSGGTFGYIVKQVGGPVVVAKNDGYVFDPASAIKPLVAAYAMRQVASGADSLVNPVTVYLYPNSGNSGGNPASPSLCPDFGDEVPSNIDLNHYSLSDVLAGMLQQSNNRFTRALEIRYTRPALNAYAASLGMSNTQIAWVCGTYTPHSTWTLDDAARLFEAIDNGAAFPESMRQQFYSLMDIGGYGLSRIVRQEANDLGLNSDAYSNVFSGMKGPYDKGGSISICTSGSCNDVVITRDGAGVLMIPFQTHAGVKLQDFIYAAYITDEVVPSCPGCDPTVSAGNAVISAISEILRPAIHQALQSWAQVANLTAIAARPKNASLKVKAVLEQTYTGKKLAGMSIVFTVGKRKLCSAKTNSAGVATCSGRFTGKPAKYSAKFGGTSGLFAASATARIMPTK